MRRASLVLAGTLIATLLIPAGVAASSAREVIELRGSRDAFVDVFFASSVRITCCDIRYADNPPRFVQEGFTQETEGAYVGFAIERLPQEKLVVGGVRIPSMDLGSLRLPALAQLARGGRLSPGRYRIHLLTDGPSIVRIEARGLESPWVLRPTNPSPVAAQLIQLIPPAGLGGHGRITVSLGESIVLLATQVETQGGQVDYVNHCITNEAMLCQIGEEDDETESTETYPCAGCGASGLAIFDVIRSHRLPPAGQYEAAFSVATAGAATEMQGFVLVFGM